MQSWTHATELPLTAAQRDVGIKMQVKPEGNCIQDATSHHLQLDNVVLAPALGQPLKAELQSLAGLGETGMRNLVQLARLIACIPSAVTHITCHQIAHLKLSSPAHHCCFLG